MYDVMMCHVLYHFVFCVSFWECHTKFH